MKKLIIIVWAFITTITINAQDARFDNANKLFAGGKFAESATAYEDILKSGLESEALYFNLGNAYYKSGQLPKAILSYERALLIDPNDKDILYNLELANSQITDRINGVGEFFLKTWIVGLINSGSSDTWAWIGIIALVVTLVSLGFFMYSNSSVFKRIGFFAAISFFILTVLTFSFSSSQKQGLINRSEAIVFASTVNVKSSPDASGTDLFVVHEGTKVKILERLGSWLKVQIKDGSEGWIPNSDIEVI